MEAHPDFGRCNGDIGGHVDEIAKDLAGLGVVVAAHAAGGQAVEGRGEDEEAADHDVVGEPTFADAILDRIVHNAYRLALDGPSMRKIQVGEAETAVPVADTTSSASTTSTKPAKGAKL